MSFLFLSLNIVSLKQYFSIILLFNASVFLVDEISLQWMILNHRCHYFALDNDTMFSMEVT